MHDVLGVQWNPVSTWPGVIMAMELSSEVLLGLARDPHNHRVQLAAVGCEVLGGLFLSGA